MLRWVARGVQHLEANIADLDDLPGTENLVGIAELAGELSPHPGTGTSGELGRSGEVIVVAVRIGHVGDAHAVLPSRFGAAAHVPARVEYQCLPVFPSPIRYEACPSDCR
ncbi:hypothetical protein SAMN04487820_105229 [Actinopolyspora mzabensis]|uniref:Uncharacterized protein n=1 Tax=Actinopolyspora mzabensis TaxID=995066 RepID=A0A1G8ZZR3_ACTMZ|nr:hypothetical protein SAMN04487820_105229 [Actinopolyspora mzabensis]